MCQDKRNYLIEEILEFELRHVQLAESFVFKKDAFGQNPFPFQNPFNSDGIYGYFAYVTNRLSNRYSRLYDEITNEKIKYGCKFIKGGAHILVCKSIIYYLGANNIDYDDGVAEINTVNLSGKYCIFQDPLSKIVKHKGNDIIRSFKSLADAKKFALDFTETKGYSTLVVEIVDQMKWF